MSPALLYAGLAGLVVVIVALVIERSRLKRDLASWIEAHGALMIRHGSLANAFGRVQAERDALSKMASSAPAAPTLADALNAGSIPPGEAPPTAQAVADATQADTFTLAPMDGQKDTPQAP